MGCVGCSAPLWQGLMAGVWAGPRTTPTHSLARRSGDDAGVVGPPQMKPMPSLPNANFSWKQEASSSSSAQWALPRPWIPAVPNRQVTLMASATDGRSWALRLAISRRRVLSLRGRASLWSWGTLNLAAVHSTAATQYTEAWGREKPAVLSRLVPTPTEPPLLGPHRHLLETRIPSAPQVRV